MSIDKTLHGVARGAIPVEGMTDEQLQAIAHGNEEAARPWELARELLALRHSWHRLPEQPVVPEGKKWVEVLIGYEHGGEFYQTIAVFRMSRDRKKPWPHFTIDWGERTCDFTLPSGFVCPGTLESDPPARLLCWAPLLTVPAWWKEVE